MNNIIYYLEQLNTDKDVIYIIARAIIVYFYAILLIRIGNKRFQLNSPFDFIMGVIIGGLLVQSINSGISLLTAVTTTLLLRLVHWLFSMLSFKFYSVDLLLKGKSQIIIKDGKLNYDVLQANQITKSEILQLCRDKLNSTDISTIKEARLEQSGNITFVAD
jgi:uncharacterized membrane protein YcaP (DUF421 family)